MYQKGTTVGEMTSNERKETATQDTPALTSPQKIVLRRKSLDLRHSDAVLVNLIQFLID